VRASLIALPALLCVLLLAGCGGDAGAGKAAATSPPPPAPAAPQPGQGSVPLAPGIPLRESGPPRPPAIRVIRLWSDALRSGDVDRAASFWAIPSKVQNGTPVLTLDSLAAVRLFNDSLSCGAQLVSGLGARDGFTIAVFVLTKRPGGDCGSGTGNHARTAIRVRGGKIAEWYRLPDDPDAPAAPAQPGPATPTEPIEPAGPII
jgi:hypothetical protein